MIILIYKGLFLKRKKITINNIVIINNNNE